MLEENNSDDAIHLSKFGTRQPSLIGVMSAPPTQNRLYMINRAGSGEALYLELTDDKSAILSYQVKIEEWSRIKDIVNFGVAVVDNTLYIIGGYDRSRAKCLNRVVRYDPTEVLWTEVAPMLKSRSKFCCCPFNGKIYVCGGEQSGGKLTASCEVYDPEVNEWSKAPRLLSPRANHACVPINNEIYCAGGYYGNQSHSNLWVFDGRYWQELDKDCPHSLPYPVDRFAMAQANGVFYFVGGVSSLVEQETKDEYSRIKFTTERRVSSYNANISTNISTNQCDNDIIMHDLLSPWNLNVHPMDTARHSAGIAVLGKRIYVFGGSNLESNIQVRTAEFFNIEKRKWELDFRFRKGDVSNLTCATLEVPVKMEVKASYRLKWVMW
ncbi:hypothetical protein ScPMuIL_010818 [Solemya velum]